jgi:hypothetical protein
MSTRCQVKVSSGVKGNQEAVTLYHHHDGYPTNMLPLMADAYTHAREYLKKRAKKYAISRISLNYYDYFLF